MASALLSLGLGIGANTAIFQLLDALRLRALPVSSPHELAEVRIEGGHRGMGVSSGKYPELTRPVWQELQTRQQAFSGMFAWAADQVNIGEGSNLRDSRAILVSGDFFRVLGIRPWRGHLVEPDDEGVCPASKAVVSYAYWQTEMGASEIGSSTTLVVDGERKEIIGVTPPGFSGLSVGDSFDIAFPLSVPTRCVGTYSTSRS